MKGPWCDHCKNGKFVEKCKNPDIESIEESGLRLEFCDKSTEYSRQILTLFFNLHEWNGNAHTLHPSINLNNLAVKSKSAFDLVSRELPKLYDRER